MINYSSTIFTSISEVLREQFEGIYVIGEELSVIPPRFPSVSIVTIDNKINKRYSTFDEIENVAEDIIKVEIYSNLEEGKSAQTLAIASVINESLKLFGYIRVFNEMIPNADPTIGRRILRFENNNVI